MGLAEVISENRLSLLEKSFKTFVFPEIPRKKALGAIGAFACDIEPEQILVLLDDTLFGSAENGLVVSAKKIYAKPAFGSPASIDLSKVKEIKAVKTAIHINGAEFIDLSMAEKITVLRLCNIIGGQLDALRMGAMSASSVKTEIVPHAAVASAPNISFCHKFPRKKLDNSYFQQFRPEFMTMLRGSISPDSAAMYLALYDSFLGVANRLKGSTFAIEEMSWLVSDDEIIFQSYILTSFIVKALLSEHLEDDEVFEFLMPLLLVMLSIGLIEQGQQPKTLAMAIDPMKSLIGTPRFKEFQAAHEHYQMAYGSAAQGASGVCSWFTLHCVDRLRQKYGEDFVAVQMACLTKGKDFQEYLYEFAEHLRPQVESILIRFFSE